MGALFILMAPLSQEIWTFCIWNKFSVCINYILEGQKPRTSFSFSNTYLIWRHFLYLYFWNISACLPIMEHFPALQYHFSGLLHFKTWQMFLALLILGVVEWRWKWWNVTGTYDKAYTWVLGVQLSLVVLRSRSRPLWIYIHIGLIHSVLSRKVETIGGVLFFLWSF